MAISSMQVKDKLGRDLQKQSQSSVMTKRKLQQRG